MSSIADDPIIYAARILGPAEWGVFSYATNLVAILAVLTDFGISAILTRETAKNTTEIKAEILSTSFFLKLLILLPGLIFIIFVAPHLAIMRSIAPLLAFFGLMLALDSIRQLGFSLIKAMERMEIQAGLYIVTNLAIVVFGFAFLYSSPSISSLTYAYVLGTGIGTIATILFLHTFWKHLLNGFSWSHAKTILTSAWPFALSSLLGSIMISTDIFILGFLRSAEEVGYYSVADRIMQILYAPSLILATSYSSCFFTSCHSGWWERYENA
jgi:O-antigen/teichoic acid export membrane protein